MLKTCRQCSVTFEVSDTDQVFYDKISPIFGGIKYQIPEPTLCPDCRKQRRLSWRNERKLYNKKCDSCKKDMVSLYSPENTLPVFCSDCWWRDDHNALDFGQNFDFSKPFFEQFAELQRKVPRMTLLNINQENAEYANHSSRNKNCYLIFNCFDCEAVLHSRMLKQGKDMIDCTTSVGNCELCYECSQTSSSCYNIKFSQYCKNCSDSTFLYDCIGCKHCYRCSGLRNKEYYFENRPYPKEDWEKLVPNLSCFSTLESEKKTQTEFLKRMPHRWTQCVNTENSTGDDLLNCKNCDDCFDIQDSEDCKWIEIGDQLQDSYDCNGVGHPGELMYEVSGVMSGYHTLFSYGSYYSREVFYSDSCQNSESIFGCIGIHHKKYCILNKQYTKEEYEALAPKIIEHMRKNGEWGEFFPASLSPFSYNESFAQEYFPLSRAVALQRLYKWSDYEAPKPQASKMITAEQMKRLPDCIDQIPDDIINWALTCEVSGKLFKIQSTELAFYRKMKLPIPHRHPDVRYADRIALRNPRKLWHRNCAECGEGIETTYSPDRPEKVLCESCYLKAVV